MKNNKILDISMLSIVWILSIYIINPLGDFPINDDFSYIEAVRRLYNTGKFYPHDWTSMTLISQAYLGYYYSLFVGFSIEKLRILVATLGLVGMIFVYFTAIELKIERKISIFISLLLGFNPIYLNYSLSFMTDVPFFFFSIISIYFYLLTLKKHNGFYWLTATTFSILALLDRQIGLFIPLAFFITYLIKEKITFKNLFFSLFPILFSTIIYILFIQWLELSNIKPLLFNNQGSVVESKFQLIILNLKNIISNIFFSLLYASMFIFPLLIIYYKNIVYKINYKIKILVGLISISIFVALVLIFKKLIPVNKNVLTSLNILGPFDDSTFYDLEDNLFFCTILSFIAIFGLYILFLFFIKYAKVLYISFQKKLSISKEIIFLILCLIIYQTPILIVTMYERYFFITIVLLSFIIVIFYQNSFKKFKINKGLIAGILLLLIISIQSIIYKKDFMSHNRVRWGIISNMIINNKINPLEIAGGISYYGTYFNENLKKILKNDTSFENNLKYYISIFPDKNMKIISEHPFNSIYKIGNNKFYVCIKIK